MNVQTETLYEELPLSVRKQARLQRLSQIFFNTMIAFGSILLVVFAAGIFTPLLWVFGVLLSILGIIVMLIYTCGLVLVIPNNPVIWLWWLLGTLLTSSDGVMVISQFFFSFTTALSIVCIVFSLGSLIFSAASKAKGKVGKIVWSCIFLIITVLALIIQLCVEVG